MNALARPARPRVVHAYWLEARNEFVRLLRSPSFAVPTLVFPPMFYVLFAVLLNHRGGPQVATHLLATYGVFGVMAPGLFGFGPVPAIRLALAQTQWQVDEVDRFEVNEAFAAVGLVVRDELGIDPARFNVDGGAIAHGHPIGATGAVLLTKVAHALQRTGEQRGIVSLCIGGGQGIALAVERP